MLNIKTLLEEGRFKTGEQCRAEGAKKESRLAVKRTIARNPPVVYHVTDVLPDKKDHWRIAAVFTMVRTMGMGCNEVERLCDGAWPAYIVEQVW